jgi:hypothetical protein
MYLPVWIIRPLLQRLPASPAVEAQLFLGQADSSNHLIDMQILERRHIQIPPDPFDHIPVSKRVVV